MRLFWSEAVNQYRWYIRSHGIDNLEFWHGGSASERSDDNKWGWSWDNIDISLNLTNQAWAAFWHETWLVRYQGNSLDTLSKWKSPDQWRSTDQIVILKVIKLLSR